MPSIQQTANGYRAQVAVLGERDSQTFKTRRDAQQWAARRETELRAGAGGVGTRKTLLDAFRRYADEVSPQRRGWRWEHLRLAAFERSATLPVRTRLHLVRPEQIALWRDARLAEVSPGTVLREVALLSAVFEAARREWRWLDSNPTKMIRKPSAPAHRERVIAWGEIRRQLRALGYRAGQPARSVSQAVALCFLAALRTGMRAGELAKCTWPQVRGDLVHLPAGSTKSGNARDVPLSTKARRVFALARGFDAALVFGVSGPSLDALFRRARVRAGLAGFTFHDARHTAATWIGSSGKLSMLEMCKMFGWRDPKHALIYFNPGAAGLAAKLG